MGEPNPDSRPRRGLQVRPARSIICRINLLDGNRFETDVDKKAVGQILFDKVCDHLDLLEKDYFGLSYIDPSTGLRNWLNVEKKISKQMKGLAWEFSFEVKFYPSDPQQLHEDLTRYQLCLQIRSDLVSGKLPATEVTYSLLGSYSVQSELGDFDVEDFGPGVEYIKKMLFAPSQDRDLLKKIAELHKSHKGKTPEEAELHFLENAKKLAMYGVDMFDCKDGDNVDIKLGICASGILVFRDKLQINKFVWPKILKMSYRRSKFYIKLRTGEFDDYQSLIAFKFLSSKHSKRIWKVCVEHHAFFRNRVFDSPSSKRGFMRFGSKFRYSGRSQFAAKQHVQAVNRPPPGFERTQSQIAKRSTFHGRTRHQRRDDDMFRPRPIPKERPPPRYSEDYIDRKPIPEPEIFDHENVFEDEESENRKNRMEKLNAVPTPLSVVMQKSNHAIENNNVDRTPPRAQQEEDDDSIHKPPLEDDEELVGRHINNPEYMPGVRDRVMHGTYTNTNQTVPRQRGRRGRSRSQGHLKKVCFDEESMRSTSSQHSRSDSELWPPKRRTSNPDRMFKKRSGRRPTKQVTIQYTGTPNARGPCHNNVERESRVYEIVENVNPRTETSIDEGFADLDESSLSIKYDNSHKINSTSHHKYHRENPHNQPISPMYSKIDAMTNMWLSEEVLGNSEMTYESELDLSPITHQSDSNLNREANYSSVNPQSFSTFPDRCKTPSNVATNVRRNTTDIVTGSADGKLSREELNRLYGYSSSDSSEDLHKNTQPQNFVRNTRQVGRRGRRSMSASSKGGSSRDQGKVSETNDKIQKPSEVNRTFRRSLSSSSNQGMGVLTSTKSRPFTRCHSDEGVTRRGLSRIRTSCSQEDYKSEVSTAGDKNRYLKYKEDSSPHRSEAILLEKYIIRHSSKSSSVSSEDIKDHVIDRGTDANKVRDVSVLDVGIPEVCEMENNFSYSCFERGATATSSTDNILLDAEMQSYQSGELEGDSRCEKLSLDFSTSFSAEFTADIESFESEPRVRRPRIWSPEEQNEQKDIQATSINTPTSKVKTVPKVKFTDIDEVRTLTSEEKHDVLDHGQHDRSTDSFSDEDNRPKLQRYFRDSDCSSCNSESISPRINMITETQEMKPTTLTNDQIAAEPAGDELNYSLTSSSDQEFFICSESSIPEAQMEDFSYSLSEIKMEENKNVMIGNNNEREDQKSSYEVIMENHETESAINAYDSNKEKVTGFKFRSDSQRMLVRGAGFDEDDDMMSTCISGKGRNQQFDEEKRNTHDTNENTDQKRGEDSLKEKTTVEDKERILDNSSDTSDADEYDGQLDKKFDASDSCDGFKMELEALEFEPFVRRPHRHHVVKDIIPMKDLSNGVDRDSESMNADDGLLENDESCILSATDHREEKLEECKSIVFMKVEQNQEVAQILTVPEIVITTPTSQEKAMSLNQTRTLDIIAPMNFNENMSQVEVQSNKMISEICSADIPRSVNQDTVDEDDDIGEEDITDLRGDNSDDQNRNLIKSPDSDQVDQADSHQSTLFSDIKGMGETKPDSSKPDSGNLLVEENDREQPGVNEIRDTSVNTELGNTMSAPFKIASQSVHRNLEGERISTPERSIYTPLSPFRSSFLPHGVHDSWKSVSKIEPPKFIVPKHLLRSNKSRDNASKGTGACGTSSAKDAFSEPGHLQDTSRDTQEFDMKKEPDNDMKMVNYSDRPSEEKVPPDKAGASTTEDDRSVMPQTAYSEEMRPSAVIDSLARCNLPSANENHTNFSAIDWHRNDRYHRNTDEAESMAKEDELKFQEDNENDNHVYSSKIDGIIQLPEENEAIIIPSGDCDGKNDSAKYLIENDNQFKTSIASNNNGKEAENLRSDKRNATSDLQLCLPCDVEDNIGEVAIDDTGQDQSIFPKTFEGILQNESHSNVFDGMMLRDADITIKPDDSLLTQEDEQDIERPTSELEKSESDIVSFSELIIDQDVDARNRDNVHEVLHQGVDIYDHIQPAHYPDKESVSLCTGSTDSEEGSVEADKPVTLHGDDTLRHWSMNIHSEQKSAKRSSIEKSKLTRDPTRVKSKTENCDTENVKDDTVSKLQSSKPTGKTISKRVSWNIKDDEISLRRNPLLYSSSSSDSSDVLDNLPFIDQDIIRNVQSDTNTLFMIAPSGVVAAPICESEDSDFDTDTMEVKEEDPSQECTVADSTNFNARLERSDGAVREFENRRGDDHDLVPSMVFRPPFRRLSSKDSTSSILSIDAEPDIVCLVSEVLLTLIILIVSIMLLLMM